MKRDNKIVGGMCIFAYLTLIMPMTVLGANAHEPPKQKAHVAKSTKIQEQHTKSDYWVPIRNWLNKQGSPLAGSAECIVDVGWKYKIDPDLLVAVSKAETNLAKVKQRGSRYNIGSVGSYDSTDTTYSASSYCHGFEQIAQTLTNAQLGRYKRVSELSRSHNPHQAPVYATSPHNWFANVSSTMRQLKGSSAQDFFIRKEPPENQA